MKFQIEKEKALEKIQIVQNIISSRTTLPILQNALFVAEGETLKISTTDLDVGITCSVPCSIQKEGTTTLPAKRLSSIFRELSSDDIHIEVDSKDAAQIECGQSHFKVLGLPKDEFPPFPKLENPKEIKLEQALLKDMFRKTAYAISHDETRYVLNGVMMNFKDKKLTVVATDGRRLALAENEVDLASSQEASVILPTKALSELQRLLGEKGDVTISIAENRASFEMDGILLITKLTDGNYPNYKQVIPSETKERITFEREMLLSTVKRIALMTSDRSTSVKFEFSKDSVKISSNTQDVGEAHETLPVKYRGKDLAIAFNPDYVLDALRNLASDEIHFDFVDELSPGVIRINSSTFLYVIMPMRISS